MSKYLLLEPPTGAFPTPAEQRALAQRFTLRDWQFFCTRPEFLRAVQTDLVEAEIIAHDLLEYFTTR